MESFDIKSYLDIALRRKYWVIIPFLLVILCGLGYTMTAAKVYEARTLILVQPQNIPRHYVRAIVSSTIEDRLKTITQQVTSRTNLEKIINEYNLFALKTNMLLFDKVKRLRELIKIDVSYGDRKRVDDSNSFTITLG